ncbi:hypothetical protein JQC91_00055 [Jannaschia sp. Os4]|uniref:histidine kinase dimerization/phosphoacceptor domain -containing protein n=1 Tax=Jannaschia sp. Os4 TaxID=2807617 RepID=UPI0019398A44|nr:histidine kinase dimerization/phosphoacceptor domain -containing protein [Jannaschia sp. Os4]MBM2574681.1 hypothetical protein [Jannaschia sp. Os4]
MLAPTPPNQAARLAAIRRYELGTQSNAGALDGLVELAAQICHCPIALVSIVHEDDQRFEARCGLDADSTGLEASICSHAILQDDILEIPDTRLDMRTRDNPLVTDPDDPLVFYAGSQIVTPDGLPLGSLCVLDRKPRRLSDEQRRALRILADQVMQRLELNEALRQAETLRREVDHRVKNNLANVSVLTRMAIRSAVSEETKEALQEVLNRINVMVELHAQLYSAPGDEGAVQGADYLGRILRHLQETAPPGVTTSSRFSAFALEGRRASALGVLVNELVSNAFKHGYPNGRGGSVRASGTAMPDGGYRVVVEDDGVGGTVVEGGLGIRIMQASASQLGGMLEVAPLDGGGWRGVLTFPLDG